MAKKSTKKGSGGFFLGAALGAIAGGIAGVLTAPKSGKETRADIARESKKAIDSTKKAVDSTSKKFGSKFFKKAKAAEKALKK